MHSLHPAILLLLYSGLFVGAEFPFFGAEQKEQVPLTSGESAAKNPFTDDVSSFIRETLEEWKVAGVSIGVIDGDQVFTQSYGKAVLHQNKKQPHTSTPHGEPPSSSTLWYTGSTTKAFTAATLSRLIHSGDYPQLARGWQTPISSLLRDDFLLQDEWATAHLTLEDAVSHRTGQTSNDYVVPREAADGKDAGPVDVMKTMRYFPLGTSPRTTFDYNNGMYSTLSHVIETVTGRWLGDVLRETIWEPLGMNNTFFDLDQAEKEGKGSLSVGYMWNRTSEEYVPLSPLPTGPISGAGAIISSVDDYIKWLQCLLNKCSIFPEVVHEDIRTPRFVQNPSPALGMDVTLYGLGWFRTTLHGEVVYYHSGGTITHGTMVYWLPGRNYAAVLMMNYSSFPHQIIMRRIVEDKLGIPMRDRYDVAKEFRREMAEAFRQMDHADEILYPSRPKEPIPPSAGVETLAGSYHAPGWGTFRFEVVPDSKAAGGKSLVAHRPDLLWRIEVKLRHVSGDFWMAVGTLSGDILSQFFRAEFRFGVDGGVEGLTITLPRPGLEATYDVCFERERD